MMINDFYEKLNSLAGRLTDDKLARMLEQTNDMVAHLIKSQYYQRVEADILTGELCFDSIIQYAEKLTPPEYDVNLLLWISGFQTAASAENSDFLLFQTVVYIASQRANVYRVKDDKLQLILTFLHVETLHQRLQGEVE